MDGGTSSATERSARFIAELDEVDRMTPEELRAEATRIAFRGGFAGLVASMALIVNDGSRSNGIENLQLCKLP